jgi:hypothetical protein
VKIGGTSFLLAADATNKAHIDIIEV